MLMVVSPQTHRRFIKNELYDQVACFSCYVALSFAHDGFTTINQRLPLGNPTLCSAPPPPPPNDYDDVEGHTALNSSLPFQHVLEDNVKIFTP